MSETTFKAKIRQGAPVFHDHGFFKWPQSVYDLDIEFDATDIREYGIKLVADGWGRLDKPGAYGSGAVFVNGLNDLIASEADRERVTQKAIQRKRAEIKEAAKTLEKLNRELDALTP